MSTTQKQTVAILGNGVVGVALAKGFAALGHRVVFGTRDTNSAKTKDALTGVPGSRATSYDEAAHAGDIAVLALPWSGLESALQSVKAASLAGKLVIDPVNPLDYSTGAPVLAIGHTDSAGELAQRLLPTSKVVKAFNIIGAHLMVHPKFAHGEPSMFIAGDDDAAKAQVAGILREFGWHDAVDMGGISASRLLEPMAMAWISYGVRNNHWAHGFSLLGQMSAQ